MPLIADFLAGSIMTLILPVALLIALVWWYLAFLRRVPEPTAKDGAVAADPGPGAAPTEAAELGGVGPASAPDAGPGAPASAPNPGPGAPGGDGPTGAGPASGEI